MTWARVLVGLSVCVAALAFAQPDQAMAVYEQGKALYDAKDYAGALEKFDAASRLEPSKARWHYNRGLALKKLKRDGDAREALLKSRALEPDYKRAEIDQKLSELGGGPSPSNSSQSVLEKTEAESETAWGFRIVAYVLIAGVIFTVFSKSIQRFGKWFISLLVTTEGAGASTADAAPKQPTNNTPDQLEAVAARLRETAEALAQVEHGLSLGEDALARGHVDRAATNLASVRKGFEAARRNQRPLSDLTQALDRASEAITLGQQRLVALYGERALRARGPRAGCFFCARALPTPEAGVAVQLRSSSGVTTVAACPTCARRVGTGTPPPVLMVDGDQRRHWSEVDEFDPYVEAHAPPPQAVEAPAWNVMNAGAAVPSLATFAGGAVLGALGAAAAGRLINLDTLKESSLASAAAEASATAATGRRTTEYSDHS
ncbi:MAG: tetratricopeptide repeat protein [Myxococcales bacterium]|nr:tetratricopeptide repeat protein [Myxococcales bacterium]